MKPHALILALAASVAHAGVFATLPNEANGQIALTDNQTKQCHGKTRLGFARSEDGHVVFGCWGYVPPYIVMQYDTGETRMYPAADFQLLHPPADGAKSDKQPL